MTYEDILKIREQKYIRCKVYNFDTKEFSKDDIATILGTDMHGARVILDNATDTTFFGWHMIQFKEGAFK